MALSPQTLTRLGVPRAKAERYVPLLANAMREHNITSKRRATYFIAQLMHESDGLKAWREYSSGQQYEWNKNLGNNRPGDGRRFKGRGPIQLTGRWNYTFYGKLLGVNLVGHPELAARPRIGFRIAAAYWHVKKCNDPADRGDFKEVTRRINGGYNGLADRYHWLRRVQGLDVVPGPPYISKGDKGDAVRVLTRRLSFVRSPKTHEPYLDGRRRRFDGETERALKRFQAEHDLKADGRYGPTTAKALARSVKWRRGRQERARERVRERAQREREAAKTTASAGATAVATGGGDAGAPTDGGGSTQAEAAVREVEELRSIASRIAALDTQEEQLQAELLRRVEALERRLGEGPPEEEKRPRRRRRKAPDRERESGRAVAATRRGDKSFFVRQSKIALARFLRAKAPDESRRLRRSLNAEARSPRYAKEAGETWETAVRAAQTVAELPVTGELDAPLLRLLRKHWPPEAIARRVVRSTPGWRAIPGQLTPNFNLREFQCKDGTPYIRGLVREKGLSKREARRRAKHLADLLERVRKREGGRPLRVTSVYRTERHNARVGGVRNSAHTRGFAADILPARGVSLGAHRGHVRAVFPSGCGYYPRQGFVHGDFDPQLGRRAWSG